MNGNPPAYRKWLARFVLVLAIFNIVVVGLSTFDVVAPLSSPWDEISTWVLLALLFALLGPTWWEERRERKADQSA